MKYVSRLLAALALTVVASAGAEAQRFGGQISFADDFDFGIGARGEFDFSNKLSTNEPFSRAFIIGTFDWYFPDCNECSYFEINPMLAIPLRAASLKPYVGAGLNIARFSSDIPAALGGGNVSDTDVGLNLLAGLKFNLSTLDAFTEARLALGGGEQFAISFGLLFGGTSSASRPRAR